MPLRPPHEYPRGKPTDWPAVWRKVEGWLVGKLAPDLPARLTKLDIADGDCIVVHSDRPLSRQHASAIKDHVDLVIAALNVDAKVLVLDGGLHISIMKTSQLPKRGAASPPPPDWSSAKSA